MANGTGSFLGILGTLPLWAQVAGVLGAVAVGGGLIINKVTTIETDHAEIGMRVDSLDIGVNGLEERVEMVQTTVDDVDDKVDRLLCIGEAERGEHSYEQCVN